MSEKELRRRKIAHYVMLRAWKLVKKAHLKLSIALRIAWKLIKGGMLRHSKVRGCSHGNRQKILEYLSGADRQRVKVWGARDYNNPFDENAVGIHVTFIDHSSFRIGYLSRELAAAISLQLDADKEMVITDYDIKGLGQKYLGLNFEYIILEKGDK